MASFQESMQDYKVQLQKGMIVEAYRGLMEYFMGLRTHLMKKYSGHFVSSLYYGYMDMTYFAFTPELLKQRGLKIAIVFIHETFKFEVWLGGYNKKVQGEYWQWFRESGWDKYRLVPTTQGEDAILKHTLVEEPDFDDLDGLTAQIERETLAFIEDVEGFLLRLKH